MRIHLRVLSAVFLLSSCFSVYAESNDTLVTVLTAAEPETQLLAMVLTFQSVQYGTSAHIILYGPAADMALKDALLAQRILVTGHFIRITHVYPG